MSNFTVNGISIVTDKREKLMDFLRNTMHLKSVKNGCNEGACGTCTIIIDGKPIKSCVLYTDKLDGKTIMTIEGLTDFEKKVYSFSFTSMGAVQCGFCIPGMIMSAKALLDANENPNKDDVKNAIKNNICRCTGYVKIEESILLAAKIFREIPESDIDLYIEANYDKQGNINSKFPRIDAINKVLGISEYVDDMELPDLVYGSAVRSAYPRAKVLSINTEKAKKLDGVITVLTADDIPGAKKIGHIQQDWDVLIPIGGTTRYLGDAIVLVCAKTKDILEEAKKLVEIEYEELTPCTSPTDSMHENAPKIHETGNLLAHSKILRGDPDTVIKNSKYVVTNHYSTPFTEHAFLETENAIATKVKGENSITAYTGDQGIFQTQKELSHMLDIPTENVRVISKMIGGAFGGKEDMSVQHHAALLAWHTDRTVKVSLSRAESILVHPKRHPFEMKVTTACDENGYLTAMKAELIADTGAYASLGGPVLQRACTHAAGPYNYHNIQIDGKAYYTNNPPAGAYRGFGVTQSCFATECNLNMLAEKVGISPWKIRYINAVKPGDELPNGQIADDSTALIETLEAVKDYCDKNPKSGIACAMKNAGVGVGLPDIGRCKLVINNGNVEILCGAACIGQGMGTVLVQIVATQTGINTDNLIYVTPDTFLTPDSGITTASRQTVFSGEATRLAAIKLSEELKTKTLKELDGREFLGEYSGVTDPMNSDKKNPVSHVAYGYATQVVTLDDNGKLKKVVAAHDVGKAINFTNIEGQIEGGVVMSLGYALTEDYTLDNCKPTKKFGTLGLFRSTNTPEIECILVQKNPSDLAFGAKGVGEISSIPTAPAVQSAYYNWDNNFRTKLPLENTPYKK